MARHNEIGFIGENVASQWCVSHGYSILIRNYRKKYGEIDIVARETGGKVHFIEVKTVSYETRSDFDRISRETWRPEENVHHHKLRKLSRVIEVWLQENEYLGEWQIDVFAVRIVPREKLASITRIENIIIE
ncbi:MAG TPA: YraN family protein [Candidatus Paceibacterota bacterium]|nr:YraN family protein [Candidatus Paceibacterota bacterium]